MYGAQTHNQQMSYILSFENDVEMYGAQTFSIFRDVVHGLRMM